MATRIRALVRRVARSYVLFVVLGVVIGLAVAPVVVDRSTSDGTVAVVQVSGAINGESAAAVSSTLQQARQSGDVKAVVLVTNSGGGGAAASEELYLQTKRTAQEMPVVASVDAAAASGAYYAIAPSDRIYAKPASTVGSVGVLATAPQTLEPNDITATTGPNKLTGGDEREFDYILESLGNAFVGAVFEQRGEELELSRSDLEQARLYSGTQAVQNGLADSIGGRQAAIEHAADEADLDNYDVQVLRPEAPALFLSRSNFVASTAPNKSMISADYFYGDQPSGPTFLMLPASYLDPETERRAGAPGNRTATTGGADVA
jgi:protease-4